MPAGVWGPLSNASTGGGWNNPLNYHNASTGGGWNSPLNYQAEVGIEDNSSIMLEDNRGEPPSTQVPAG